LSPDAGTATTAGEAYPAGVSRAGERRSWIRALASSPWAWVAAVFGLSFVARTGLAFATPGPWILPDELVYTDMARSVAEGHLPAVRGVTSLGWGAVYPLLVAPAWLLFQDGLAAYHAALVVNSLVMSLAAVPAFLFARMVVTRRAAILVAAGAVLVPMLVLTGSVMTENAAYPLFLLTLWLMARAVLTPTLAAQAATLAGLAALVLTRVQGVALVPAFVAAVATYTVLLEDGTRRPYLRRFAPSAAVLGVGLLGAVVVSVAGWGHEVLAGRSGAAGDVVPSEVPRQLGLQLGGLILMVAVVPFVATAVMIAAGLSRRAPERYRLFASIAWPTLTGTLALVAIVATAIALDGAEGVNSRYLFYLAPLLLTGFAAWYEATPGRGRTAVAVLAVATLVVALLPFDDLAVDATLYAPSLAPWVALAPSGVLGQVVVGTAVLILGLVWLRLGSRGARVATVWTASWLALVTVVAVGGSRQHADVAIAALAGDGPAWIDHATPPGASVAVLWDQRTPASAPDRDYYPLMVAAVLDRSVGPFLRLGDDTFYEPWLPTTPVTRRSDMTLAGPTGELVRARFVLVPCNVGVAGRVVARGANGRLALVRTDGRPLRVGASTSCP
jgi:hypothetical protein